jgi:hypothetical protein
VLFYLGLQFLAWPFLCASYGIKHPGCSFGMSVFSNRCVNLCFSAQSRRGCESIGKESI